MIEKAPQDRRRKLAVAASLAASLTALAFLAPNPAAGAGQRSTSSPASPPPATAAPQDTTRPQFTPYTVGPRLENREAAVAAVENHYPDSLKKIGVGGTVKVWLYIDERGAVRDTRIGETSGVEALDEAALTTAAEFAFTPALNHDEPVSVWIQIPISFSAATGGPTEAARSRLRAMLRMIATIQEHRYQETGQYYQSLDAILDQLRQARDEETQAIAPNEDEEVRFEAGKAGWAAVARNGEIECAMYYGEIAAPTDYAEHGRAVCK
jgi:TonB family protein